MRVAALWFPDWPVQAAIVEGEIERSAPAAVVSNHRVRACSQAARAKGVRREMKIRHAQALCPQLAVVEDNPERDGRTFAVVAAGLDDVAASIEVLRPGLVVVDIGAAERFHGPNATEMLIDATSYQGVDVSVGVADEIATAVIAARRGAVVEDSREFLASQPLGVLHAEVALGCDPQVVDSLAQLGLRTLGDLAGLPATAVATRFGAAGQRCHAIARAQPDRRVAPDQAAEDLSVAVVTDEPIERVDAAAFSARQLAARLHQRLRSEGKVCQRLMVRVEFAEGATLERVWRTRDALSESATADRVRWQLDGWLTGGGSAGGMVRLELVPLETTTPEQPSLWGQGNDDETARRVIARVQSTLGIEAVLQPRLVGGRGVDERVEMVPYGEQRDEVATQNAPWPGQVLPPLPARLGGGPTHPAARIRMIDAQAANVYVTPEALLSSTPYALGWGKKHYLITGWAGPWPVDAAWWQGSEKKVARLQVVGRAVNTPDDSEHAWLLVWEGRSWRVEATYG